MTERVFLVHGWSVNSTDTYQALHEKLAENGFALHDVHLGRYVSLDDSVQVTDIANALQRALRKELGPPPWKSRFHIVTHSTGALVVKQWIVDHYTGKLAANKALRNLVFLAGPHFGSRLAHHGRSMLSHALYWGDTGKEILESLELGSQFSWDLHDAWLDGSHWKAKGIRPYCLVGDRVEGGGIKKKLFPAAYETGSDMVVRCAAANLNFRRFHLDGARQKLTAAGRITGVPFAALSNYVHSGARNGIMNSIKRGTARSTHQALGLILKCLGARTAADYTKVRDDLSRVTRATRKSRRPFAQLDFRFRDDSGRPIDDYSVLLGAIVKGRDRASKTVADVHKNKIDGSLFTLFLDLKKFEPRLTYFLAIDIKCGQELYSYSRDPLRVEISGKRLRELIAPDQTTQIDVTVDRVPGDKLFVFHAGDDPDLHLTWNRKGEIRRRGKSPE